MIQLLVHLRPKGSPIEERDDCWCQKFRPEVDHGIFEQAFVGPSCSTTSFMIGLCGCQWLKIKTNFKHHISYKTSKWAECFFDCLQPTIFKKSTRALCENRCTMWHWGPNIRFTCTMWSLCFCQLPCLTKLSLFEIFRHHLIAKEQCILYEKGLRFRS